MPELPEVEVFRRDMEREAAGKKIKAVEVKDKKTVTHHRTRTDFSKRLDTFKIKSFDRRGPYIIGKLDSDEYWVINLGADGRLIRQKGTKAPTDPAIKVSVQFTQGGGIHIADVSGTAETFVLSKAELEEDPGLSGLGVDPLETPVPWQQFGAVLRAFPKQKLKALLMNPQVVAGIGMVYSDEILFHAGLRYDRTPDTLSTHEVRRLYRGMIETLMAAVKARGVSMGEDDVDMFGTPGQYNAELKVFGRAGEICQRCRGTVEKARFAKKQTFYCSSCQS